MPRFAFLPRKWALYALAFVAVSLCAGLVYGWPSLRLNLLESSNSTLSEQELGAIFTGGAWSTQGGRFLFGLARDRYGTKRTAVASLMCVVGGSLGVALANANSAPQLGVSLFLIGLGSGAQLCMQPVAGLFPSRGGTVIASLSGAFQVSGLIFLALTSITENRLYSFTGFAVVVGALAILSAAMLPRGSSFVLPSQDGEPNKSMNANAAVGKDDEGKGPDAVVDEEESVEANEAWEQEHDALRQSTFQKKTTQLIKLVLRAEYLALLTWFSILIIPLQYYIGSIGFQLRERGDTGFYTHLFSILYASAAALAPIGGYLADLLGLGFTQALATTLSASSFFVLASPVDLNAQSAGLAAYGIGRMLVFGMYFSNIGKRFGYANYGLLAGLGLLISAIVSLAQYPLIALAAEGKARQVNLACGAILVCTLPYCLWLDFRERKRLDEAEDGDEGSVEKIGEDEEARVEQPPRRPALRQTFLASFLRRGSYFAR